MSNLDLGFWDWSAHTLGLTIDNIGMLNLEQPCLPVLGVGQESRFGESLVNLHLLRPRDLRVTDCKYFSKFSGVNWSLIPLRLGIPPRGIFLITISLGASGLRD
jgi:hypothetical protein